MTQESGANDCSCRELGLSSYPTWWLTITGNSIPEDTTLYSDLPRYQAHKWCSSHTSNLLKRMDIFESTSKCVVVGKNNLIYLRGWGWKPSSVQKFLSKAHTKTPSQERGKKMDQIISLEINLRIRAYRDQGGMCISLFKNIYYSTGV